MILREALFTLLNTKKYIYIYASHQLGRSSLNSILPCITVYSHHTTPHHTTPHHTTAHHAASRPGRAQPSILRCIIPRGHRHLPWGKTQVVIILLTSTLPWHLDTLSYHLTLPPYTLLPLPPTPTQASWWIEEHNTATIPHCTWGRKKKLLMNHNKAN